MYRKHPSKCIVGACVRNCMPYLPESLKNIKRLEQLFDEIYVVIAFDQSDDQSFHVLKQFQPSIRHFKILINHNTLSSIRTERIAEARNAVLEHVDTWLSYEEYPFLIMMDMDDVCATPIRLDVLDEYIERDDWDTLSFNRPKYYDIWALSDKPYQISCWHLSDHRNTTIQIISLIQDNIIKRLSAISDDELVDVCSAFAGFAMYRRTKFRDCWYSPHFPLNTLTPEEFRQTQETLAQLPFPNINQFEYDGIISGDCEHRAFHFAAIAKHGAKIRISPKFLF